MRISDWSSDVCSSDLPAEGLRREDQRNATAQGHALADQQLDQALGAVDVGEAVAFADIEYRVTGADRLVQAVGILQQRLLVEQIGRASSRERVQPYV